MSKILVRVFRCWDVPDILRQTPGYRMESPKNNGFWDDVEFVCEEDGECDFAVVLNRVGRENRYVVCPAENVFAVFQEPYVFRSHDWLIDDHKQFSKVLTPYIFNKDPKYIAHFPLLAWYIDKTYDELKVIDVPQKTHQISWITSNKSLFPGHKERIEFLDYIRKSDIDIDIFGKGIRPIDNKWDGQAPYKYSLVVENHAGPDHWTEKVSDSFLAYSLPIYYGCTNLEDYFPEQAFIRIDIHKPEEAVQIIRDAIANNEWEKRLDAIKQSRDLVLDTYNFFPYMAHYLKQFYDPEAPRQSLTLKPYRRTMKRRLLNLAEKIRRFFKSVD